MDIGTDRLETERLILKKIELKDLDDLFENWSSDKITTKYFTFKTHSTKEETLKFINYWIKEYEKNSYRWAIELKENNKVIGIISTDKSYKYKCLELGYSISSKYFNQGIITEALNKIIDYLFNKCNYYVLEAIIPKNNISSKRVAEKIGMTLEATLKNRYMDKDNILQDLLIYSKFNEIEQCDNHE